MKRSFSDRVERGRVTCGSHLVSASGDDFGFFYLTTNAGQRLGVMLSAGSDEVPWEEMCWVKSLFFEEEEVVVQYHPRKSEYVNHHPFCLHIWRPLAADLPTPPSIAVGPLAAEVT